MNKYFTTLLILVLGGSLVAQTSDVGKPRVTVTDISINAGQNVNWTNDNVYMLDGFVYVEDGATLNIQQGTVIKALESPSNGTDVASALIISRGAKINAEGSAEAPIIFTTEYDSVTLKDDGVEDILDFTDKSERGYWGGLVVLGKAELNIADEKNVEGLPEDQPNKRSWYGGDNDEDDSGVLRFISIRYTGITIEANKELQGLTLGCVGSGTIIEYVESWCSDDDGFEFFGGTVNTRYLISAFNTDDSFDFDQGFRGNHQFWFVIQRDDLGDKMGEYDSGDDGALTAEPRANPQIYNATFIGSGAVNTNPKSNDGLNWKEFGGGAMYNSIFVDFGGVATIVDSGAGETSYTRLTVDGDLNMEYNIWFKDDDTTLDELSGGKSWIEDYFATHNNDIKNPYLNGISRTNDSGLNPTLGGSSPAWTNSMKSYPEESFFDEVNYLGAFGDNNWALGWTALDFNDVFGDVVNSVKKSQISGTIPDKFSLSQNYPNPFNPSTTIDFVLPSAKFVTLSIYNILGQKIATLANGMRKAGSYSLQFDASDLASGWYIYRLQTDSKVLSRKMLLIK